MLTSEPRKFYYEANEAVSFRAANLYTFLPRLWKKL